MSAEGEIALGGDVALGDGLVLRYGVQREALPAELAARFVPCGYDAAARRFVEQALAAPHGALRTRIYGLLRRVMTDYDAYALLGMYPMHLWSAEQLRALLAAAGLSPRGRLLDVGAGSGGITAVAAHGFEEVLVTERSPPLARALRRRGYTVLPLDLGREPLPADLRAELVTCLNVLDRTAYPRTMLAHLRGAVADGGALALSLPLPLRPHVQRAGQLADPEEPLPVGPGGFEAAVARLHEQLLAPAGLSLRAWARLPYVCRGDASCALYVLDAAVLLCGVARG